jgi:hypothetical protein
MMKKTNVKGLGWFHLSEIYHVVGVGVAVGIGIGGDSDVRSVLVIGTNLLTWNVSKHSQIEFRGDVIPITNNSRAHWLSSDKLFSLGILTLKF